MNMHKHSVSQNTTMDTKEVTNLLKYEAEHGWYATVSRFGTEALLRAQYYNERMKSNVYGF